MRRIIWRSLAAGAAVSTAGAAMAQQAETRSVDDYLCIFAGQCGEQDEPEVTREGPETKGFRLVRRSPPRSSSPASTAGNVAERSGSAAPVPAPRTSRVAVAAARQRAPARARAVAESRADLRLTFESGSATLTQQAREEAGTFAQALLSPVLASRRFRIEGHTDSVGGRSHNLDLSRRRAEAVAEFLSTLGVPRERLEVLGFGYDRPLRGRSAGAAENRRVEAVLISVS